MWTLRHVGYGTGSGITNFAASNGLQIVIVWLILSFRSLCTYYDSKVRGSFISLMLLFLGQAELYLGYIYLLSLPFLKYTKPK